MTDIRSQLEAKRSRIESLENEARKRDSLQEQNNRKTIDEFFRIYPDNYREKLNEENLRLINHLNELQNKLSRYTGEKDVNKIRQLNKETNTLRTQIKHLRKNLNILQEEANKRDNQKSKDLFEKESWEKNQDYVQATFETNPTSYWQVIHKGYDGLNALFTKMREYREKLNNETDEEERKQLQTDIEINQKLINYRRARFAALEYEAKKKDKENEPITSALIGLPTDEVENESTSLDQPEFDETLATNDDDDDNTQELNYNTNTPSVSIIKKGEMFQIIGTEETKYLEFSGQLGYMLGFENPKKVKNYEIAKYRCDLKGGVNSFCVYVNGITENIIVGDQLTSLLRIVAVEGDYKVGHVVEKLYHSPMYNRVIVKELNEIEIEIRTREGRLVPFQFGTTLITLVFKKSLVF